MSQKTSGPVEYDQFRLHDGDDEQKTVELHTFMKPLIDDGHIFEWEGSDSGITIVMHVRPDDTIQRSADGWVRVVKRTELGAMTFTSKDM
jgi:hypothetical protein